jgi:hypothetical protein
MRAENRGQVLYITGLFGLSPRDGNDGECGAKLREKPEKRLKTAQNGSKRSHP